MASNEVNVIALVENLELSVPRKLPARFLHNEPAMQQRETSQPASKAETTGSSSEMQVTTNVMDLSNRETKEAVKKRLNADTNEKLNDAAVVKASVSIHNNAPTKTESKDCKNMGIPSKVQAGTVSSRQVATASLPIQDTPKTTRDSVLSCKSARKISQRMRGGMRKTLEVRRNPMRASTRNKDIHPFPSNTSTRRLLAGKRRSNVTSTDTESNATTNSGKRSTGRPTPYMNTRSVTRKLGNVGAMHEAPTRLDEAEWREWPVHGMHERPVYHPQFGLAAEYNGRLFASFDGEGYREVGPEPQIEIVRVDPRVESLDASAKVTMLHNASSSSSSSNNISDNNQDNAAQRKVASSATHFNRLPISNIMALQQLQQARDSLMRGVNLCQNLGLTQRQIEHLRNLERLHHYENLQRLGSRVQLKPASETITSTQQQQQYQQKFTTPKRIITKETLRNLCNPTLTHSTQQHINPSKCVILPRASVAPVTLPLCGVQAVKSSEKGKFYFIKATDALKKPIAQAEKPATMTLSSLISPSSANIPWKTFAARNKVEVTSTVTIPTRTFTISNANSSSSKVVQQPVKLATSTGSNYKPIRLAESAVTSLQTRFMQSKHVLSDCSNFVMKKCNNAGGVSYRSLANDEQMSEVLDLSKKEVKSEKRTNVAKASEDVRGTKNQATDLVHYFQNFGADESIDTMEDSKNLT